MDPGRRRRPAIADDFEPGSVVLVDEPDVIRKRGIAEKMAGSPMLP